MAVVQLEDLHGTIEAVVFPRTYAVNPDLWREDAIVLVKGRIDVRGLETQDEEVRGVPQILVESAEAWDPSQATDDDPTDAAEAPAPTEGHSPTWPDDDYPAQPLGFAASEPALSAWTEAVDSEIQPASPATVGLPSTGPPATGLPATVAEPAEGYLADLGYSGPEPTDIGPAEVEADPIPTRIAIVFRESEDRSADMDRLHRLHGALARSSGADPYVIVFERAGERRQLVGEHLRTAYCPQLHQEVEAILGSGSLELMAT
jgi:DNA polymerase-3 subunit alpha